MSLEIQSSVLKAETDIIVIYVVHFDVCYKITKLYTQGDLKR